ncbi:ABC transporter permease [Bacillus sp. CLL-7-23]|uniref:ABC transporter permease n=1 Tax=Bacillus changyiensis TaxID=3004103 RepID=A0ABT4X7H8_9BACI|nr:ABC transporter permease [Bacillus changyiensis]MDA7028193.1 ABC transporter permease [Bacillus changyiensis]
MLKLIYNEWIKIFSRKGTYVMIGFLLLAVIAGGFIVKAQGIGEASPDWKKELIQQNEEMKKDLKKPEMAYMKEQYKESIALNEYHIKHDISNGYSMWKYIDDNGGLIQLIGLFVITIAGGIVASEFNWGTIKLLVIRPISRFKILLSKYLTLLLFSISLLLFLFIASGIIGLVFFGTGDGSEAHLTYVNGSVKEQNILFYLIQYYLLNSIVILMLATMAFMISAVFRNSLLAVGISMFLLFSGNMITPLLMHFDWGKYFLFANTDLMMYINGTPPEGMTFGFSVTILVIYFVIFHLLAFSVFSKRDIAS